MDASAPKVPRSRLFAILFATGAVLVATVTALGLYGVLNGYQAQIQDARQGQELRAVVAATADLLPGKPIVESSLAVVKLPVGAVPAEGTYGTVLELVGKVPAERVLKGEVLRKEHLEGFAPELAGLILAGNRAISIQADHAAGVGGLVVPGNRVDVMVTIRPDSSALGADWVTETILQAVRVLAVGPEVLGATDADAGGGKPAATPAAGNRAVSVTLEVTPLEAEKIALAASRGVLHLSLRNPDDVAVDEPHGPLIANALVGISGTAASGTARARGGQAPARPAAEVIEGTRTVLQNFDEAGRKVVSTPGRRPSAR